MSSTSERMVAPLLGFADFKAEHSLSAFLLKTSYFTAQ